MLIKKDLEKRTDIEFAILEEFVPSSHLVRMVDKVIDLSFIHEMAVCLHYQTETKVQSN